ncbi:MAG: metallophosphoesterase [Anaerolineae bacterium]|nr:metallophosphoesterase [Anaerolineae bacterium]
MPLSRRKFLKISVLSALGTVGAGVGGFGYAHDIEPDRVEVVRVNLTLPRLNPAFNGYQLVQISDIHIDTGMTKERLQRIVQMVNDLQPDAIAITGDYITGRWLLERSLENLVEVLSGLRAKDAAVAVLGNHDHWTDANGVRGVLRDSGLTELSNAVHTVRRGDAMLHLSGVDDYWERNDRLDEVLDLLPEEGAAILLAHEPDYADISAATGRFDLQISGHSHGGQVIIPVLNRPVVVPTYGRKYPLGRYQVGTMIQYTNRGLGTVPPAVRFNCRPEITLFTLSGSTG